MIIDWKFERTTAYKLIIDDKRHWMLRVFIGHGRYIGQIYDVRSATVLYEITGQDKNQIKIDLDHESIALINI